MKFFNWIKRLFRISKPKHIAEKPVIAKEETPTVQMAAAPGIKCPECGNRIVISILQLTSYQPVQCGFCGLELSIDKEKSSQSIAALSKLEKTLADAARQQRDAVS